MSERVTDLRLGIQEGSDSVVYAQWGFPAKPKKHLDKFNYSWSYKAGEVWFAGESGSTKTTKAVTYNAPSNARYVRFTITPVSTKDKVKKTKKKNSKGKTTTTKTKVYWWSGKSKTAEYNVKGLASAPSTPSVSVNPNNKYQLILDVEDTDNSNSHIYFDVAAVSGATIKASYTYAEVRKVANKARAIVNVVSGYEYIVRCQGVNHKNGRTGSNWSSYSSAVSVVPAKPANKVRCSGVSSSSINVSWPAVAYAKSYCIEYGSEERYFDGSGSNTQTIENITTTSKIVEGLDSGKRWYFRVKARNDAGDSDYTSLASAVIGTKPSPPTTWSSVTKANVSDKVYLRWIHNSESGTTQTGAEITLKFNPPLHDNELNLDVGSTSYRWKNDRSEDDKDKTAEVELWSVLKKFTPSACKIKWYIRTQDIVGWSDLSVEREIDVYEPAGLTVDIPELDSSDPNLASTIMSFPFTINMKSTPSSQTPISYHISIIADDTYKTSGDDDELPYAITKGQEIFSKNIDTSSHEVSIQLTPYDVTLIDHMPYHIICTVAMDTGLTAEAELPFDTWFKDATFSPSARYGIDDENLTAMILPYCFTGESSYFEEEDEVTEDMLAKDVTLSVYRINVDGTCTEIASELPNDMLTWVTDPHPALDVGRYRIVATSSTTGQAYYDDIETDDIRETSLVIQWGGSWKNLKYTNREEAAISDDIEETLADSMMLKLPYNIDISDSTSIDVALVEYIGRESPVSYYGTQIGQKATWSADIERTDTTTLNMLRQLARWTGDCYVREPSGSGYWANVAVSFKQTHNQVVIPVSLTITRVEGGV